MNKKISLGLSLAVLFISIAITVAITMSVSMRTYNDLIKDLPNRAQLYSSVSEIDEIVRSNYFGTVNENLLNSEIADGYANGLGDKYSYYMTASEYEAYSNQLAGEKIGVGIIAFYNEFDSSVYAAEVSDNSPAAQSGISKGDKIVEIDEEKITAHNYNELIEKLNGDKLSSVKVRFEHDGKQQTAAIVKGYSEQSVFSSLNGSVGYIKITDFNAVTASQLKNTVKALSDKGVTSLILDVRGTKTGTIEFASKTLDVLVPVTSEGTGALATIVNKDDKVVNTYTADADSVSMPMQVLVNAETSGPAELFACDLRDYGKAKLIGVNTAGNGTMQKAYQLSNGGALMLTVAGVLPYVSPSYNAKGLVPDYEVKLTDEQNAKLPILAQSEDAQYQKAFDLLSGK